MAKKRINRKSLLNFLGIALIIIAVALLGLTMLMQVKEFAERYDELLKMLADFEDAVAAIQVKELVVIAILLIYIAKSLCRYLFLRCALSQVWCSRRILRCL